MADIAVGIDLGTTFSVAAHLDNQGRPWTLTNTEGDLTTPSVVFFDTNGPIIGKEAVKAALFEPSRVAQFAKRNMGDRVCERPICGRELPPEIIQALVLKKVKCDAELKLGLVREAVITVPAYFNEPRRKATQDAGRLAGLEVLDIINEPTAAAIAFGVQQGFLDHRGESARKETILIYDLGGGTFDVTLMEIDGQNYRALATAGDVRLGGMDWDMRIVDFVANRFREEFGMDPRDDEHAQHALLLDAVDAKHALSVREEVAIQFSCQGNRLRVPLSRTEFESLTGDLLDRTFLTIQKVMRESKLNWADLTRLLLVGGSTRMPMVPHMLEKESGLNVDRSLAPDEAVAHGAAVYAGLLAGSDALPRKGMSVANVNSHDLGVLGIEPDTGLQRKKVLIARNTTLPANRTATFVTRRDGQPNVLVTVIEGGDSTGEHATHIGKCVVTNLPQNLPAKTPVEVSFNYSTNGRLTIAALLPTTGGNAEIEIWRFSGQSEEKLAKWQKRIETGTIIDEQDEDQSAQLAQTQRDKASAPIDDGERPDLGQLPDRVQLPDGVQPPDGVDGAPSVDFGELAKLDSLTKETNGKEVRRDDTALNDFLKSLDQ